jgi:hypothetical protein
MATLTLSGSTSVASRAAWAASVYAFFGVVRPVLPARPARVW